MCIRDSIRTVLAVIADQRQIEIVVIRIIGYGPSAAVCLCKLDDTHRIGIRERIGIAPVSYTHLDVYKRQHIFILGDVSLGHVGKPLLPAGGQLRV